MRYLESGVYRLIGIIAVNSIELFYIEHCTNVSKRYVILY